MRLGGGRSRLERRSVYRSGFDTPFVGTPVPVAPLPEILGSSVEPWVLAGGLLKNGEVVLEEPCPREKACVSVLCMKPGFLVGRLRYFSSLGIMTLALVES